MQEERESRNKAKRSRTKASQASKNPLRERRFVVRYKHFLKDLMFCYEKMKINWPIRRGLPNNLILFRQKGKYVKSSNCPPLADQGDVIKSPRSKIKVFVTKCSRVLYMAIFLCINALVINYNRIASLLEHVAILNYNRLASSADWLPTYKRINIRNLKHKYILCLKLNTATKTFIWQRYLDEADDYLMVAIFDEFHGLHMVEKDPIICTI